MTDQGGGAGRTDPAAQFSPGRVAVVAVAVCALVVVGQLIQPRGAPAGPIELTAALAVSFTIMGAMILFAVRGHPVGRLMTAGGVSATLAVIGASWASVTPLAWLSQWTWWPPYGLITLALLLFPDGRLPSRRWAPLAVVISAGTAMAAVALGIAAFEHPKTLLVDTATPISPRAQAFVFVALVGVALTVAGLLGVLVALFVRWLRAGGETRRQLACLLPAAVVLALALVAGPFIGSGAGVIAGVAIPAGMTLAILRYRLYNLDTIINRTIVWLVMSLLVVAAFIATVTLIRQAVTSVTSRGTYESLIATCVIAVAFEPARRRVQRGVDRLLYGERDDPYLVIARLGKLLGRTQASAVLPLLTETIAESLRVPYVGVEIEDGRSPLAGKGRTTTPVETFPMTVHGEQVGRLLVATRSPNGRFTRRERRLLTDLAVHAAVAVETVRLIQDLQRSRERLVLAREEERRRIRRDLHDGVGPTLTGMSMQLRAAQKDVTTDSHAAELLASLAGDLRMCSRELRQLVDQLRPPTLDNGLEAALRVECNRFHGDTLSINFTVLGNLNDLPAALEVAALRIVSESLTNVARHSRARTCEVTVERSGQLSLEVVDDGIGIDDPDGVVSTGKGLGLTSIRERADELGGECAIRKVEPTGTGILVRLPLTAGEQTPGGAP